MRYVSMEDYHTQWVDSFFVLYYRKPTDNKLRDYTKPINYRKLPIISQIYIRYFK